MNSFSHGNIEIPHLSEISSPEHSTESAERKLEIDDVSFYKVEAAAHAACKFFGLPDLPLSEGERTQVWYNSRALIGDERLEYNKQQFIKMGWTSFEDQVKVWTHEIGHVLLQGEKFKDSWACELGADMFVGIRSEMLNLPDSEFERSIGKECASQSHPPGVLRTSAFNCGRAIARELLDQGIQPNWDNCCTLVCKYNTNEHLKHLSNNISVSFTGYKTEISRALEKISENTHKILETRDIDKAKFYQEKINEGTQDLKYWQGREQEARWERQKFDAQMNYYNEIDRIEKEYRAKLGSLSL